MSLKSFKGPFEDTSTDSLLQALAAKLEGQHLNLFFVNAKALPELATAAVTAAEGGGAQPLQSRLAVETASGDPLVRTRPIPLIRRSGDTR